MDPEYTVRTRTATLEVVPEPAITSDPESPEDTGATGGQEPAGSQPDNENNTSKPNPFKKLIATIHDHPRLSLAIGFGVLLVLSGVSAYFLAVHHRKPAPAPVTTTTKKKAAPTPTIITSPLTGLPVTAKQSTHTVTGVMIENTTFARPQSGLMDAGVVFEAIAEAGITRFLALFQESQPANVGPIRSARPYYVDWAHSFDAPLAHVGGSPDALSKIKSEGTKDLDQFYNAGAYHRVSSREAPHNMYSSMAALNTLEANKGWTTSAFTPFQRKKDEPSKTPVTHSVDIAISGPTYNVHYDYDATNNYYLRSEGGAPHKDAETGAQLHPKVVIGLVAPYSLMSDGYHSQYQITGSGPMTVFQDGTATKGTWTRTSAASQYTFTDESGKPLKLNAGQTWITVVGASGAITYK